MTTDSGSTGPKRCLVCQRTYGLTQRFCAVDGQPLSLPDPYHLAGRTIAGRYRLEALVGIGGMGAVYCAWHLAIDRRVAVKILQPNIAIIDQRMVALFEREAKMVGRLSHENITDVFDAGRTDEGIAYIVMEWLDGRSLEEELAVETTLTLHRLSHILQQIAAALDAAHAAQIVHRDLKPANVMLVNRPDGSERVKVVDFGIAKALGDVSRTSTRSVMAGTPAYASPEQLSGTGEIDARSDIYSLGVIMYRALTGRFPFLTSSIEELRRQKSDRLELRLRQRRPDAPAAIEALLERMLSPDVQDRPTSPTEVSRAFARAIEATPAVDAPPAVAVAPADEDSETMAYGRTSRLHTLSQTIVPIAPFASIGGNPLLSELRALPRVERWVRAHAGGGTLALGAAAAAIVAIVLSHIVGSACIQVSLRGPSGLQQTILFGYVAELNAGLWYLVGVPIFVLAAAHFLRLAESALRQLAEGERLIAVLPGTASPAAVLDVIADRNRRLFRIVAPAIVVLSTVAVVVPEYGSGGGPAFGWVGALSVSDYEGASIEDLQARQKVGWIPALTNVCPGSARCDVRVARVTGGHGTADRDRWLYPFAVFATVALGLQVLFGSFAGWIAAKILFLFATLTRALVNRRRPGLRIVLDVEDTELRFGLGALDIVHNIVLLLTLVMFVMLFISQMTNVAKGTSFFAGMRGVPLSAQLGVFFISLLPLVLVLIAPMAVFMILIETEVGRTLARIERERAVIRKAGVGPTPPHEKAQIAAAEQELRVRRSLVRQQRPWPRHNASYRLLLAANAFMVAAVPISIVYLSTAGQVPMVVSAFMQLSEIVCWLL